MPISKPEVTILASDTHLHAQINGISGESFAFYVYRNNERVHIQWYSPRREVEFEHGDIPGVYRVSAFSRDGDDDPVATTSRDCIVFGGKVDISNLDDSVLVNRPMLVSSGKHDFHCLLYRGVENRLFVLLTAAIERPYPLPVFNRWIWRDRFPGSVLCISDPTLLKSEKLGIGWYLGCEENDATSDMAELVKAVAKGIDVKTSNVISYGSSAGGFSALALASRIPDALAVAINPQTDATKYNPQPVGEMVEHCFPNRTLEEVRQLYPLRVDMTLAIPQSQARVIIAQNTKDTGHWKPHFLPFALATGLPIETGRSTDGRHSSIVYSDDNGHAPEPPEIFEKIIDLIKLECKDIDLKREC